MILPAGDPNTHPLRLPDRPVHVLGLWPRDALFYLVHPECPKAECESKCSATVSRAADKILCVPLAPTPPPRPTYDGNLGSGDAFKSPDSMDT